MILANWKLCLATEDLCLQIGQLACLMATISVRSSDQDVDVSAVCLPSASRNALDERWKKKLGYYSLPAETAHDFNKKLRVDSKGCIRESGRRVFA